MADIEETRPEEGEVIVDAAEEAPTPTVEDYARAKGWKPKEEWDESRGEWRDANSFLDFTFDRNRDLSKDLKELRRTTETMAETQARIMREQLDRAREEERRKWEGIHQQAVIEGDVEAAANAARSMAQVAQPQPGADPLVSKFVAENPWFMNDPIANAVATAASGQVGARGGSVAEQIEAARDAVFKRFPEYAPKSAEPAKVVEVAQPSSTAQAPKRGKTFHDLPREAQEAARQMVAQGLLKNTDGYVRQYFNKEGTVE